MLLRSRYSSDAVAFVPGEIDVDVRWLAALRAHEALEEQAGARGIHRRDAQHEAHGAVRSAAAPLTQNASGPRDLHDLPGGQEVGRDAELRDERELLFDLRRHSAGHAARITPPRALLAQAPELLVRGLSRLESTRKLIPQLIQRERELFGHLAGALHPGQVLAKQLLHLELRAQERLGIGPERCSRAIERDALANAVHHVRHRLSRLLMKERPPAGHHVEAVSLGPTLHCRKPCRILGI